MDGVVKLHEGMRWYDIASDSFYGHRCAVIDLFVREALRIGFGQQDVQALRAYVVQQWRARVYR
jgi:hypothetical protein